MPLADLLTDTAKSELNALVGKHEMSFDVLMWSVEARRAVYRHLTKEGAKEGWSLIRLASISFQASRSCISCRPQRRPHRDASHGESAPGVEGQTIRQLRRKDSGDARRVEVDRRPACSAHLQVLLRRESPMRQPGQLNEDRT